MANSKLTLTYFDITGRAELSRLLLNYAGKEFTDNRVTGPSWQEFKPKTPFGQLPVLEVDGKIYGQSWAFTNYLAREFNLFGKTNLDGLNIQIVEGLAEDFIRTFGKIFGIQDEAEKNAYKEKLKTEDGPKFLGFFENLLKENGTGFFVGSSLTLADLVVFDMATGFLREYLSPSLEKFPQVKAFVDKVGSDAKLKDYLAKRKT